MKRQKGRGVKEVENGKIGRGRASHKDGGGRERKGGGIP